MPVLASVSRARSIGPLSLSSPNARHASCALGCSLEAPHKIRRAQGSSETRDAWSRSGTRALRTAQAATPPERRAPQALDASKGRRHDGGLVHAAHAVDRHILDELVFEDAVDDGGVGGRRADAAVSRLALSDYALNDVCALGHDLGHALSPCCVHAYRVELYRIECHKSTKSPRPTAFDLARSGQPIRAAGVLGARFRGDDARRYRQRPRDRAAHTVSLFRLQERHGLGRLRPRAAATLRRTEGPPIRHSADGDPACSGHRVEHLSRGGSSRNCGSG